MNDDSGQLQFDQVVTVQFVLNLRGNTLYEIDYALFSFRLLYVSPGTLCSA